MSFSDRRQHPRFEGEFQVDLLNMGDDPRVSPWEAIVAGKALDISKSGLRLKIDYDVPVGTPLSAIVYYKGMDSVCLCDVVWKRENDCAVSYGLFIKEWCRLDRALEKRLNELERSEPDDTGPSGTLAPSPAFLV